MNHVVTTHENGGLVYRGRYDPLIVDAVKNIPGRRWVPHKKEWLLPVDPYVIEVLRHFPQVRITLEAWDLVRESEKQKDAVRAMKDVERPEMASPMPIRVKPFAHQVQAYNIGTMLDRSALLHEQGCGKTLTAIAVAGRRFLDGQIKKLLVVAPLSVLPVWEKEFRQFADYPYELRILMGTAGKRVRSLEELSDAGEALQVALVNYEAVWLKTIFLALEAWGPDMIIADESQKMKNPQAKQSRGMHGLAKKVNYKMILTGTPVTATPLDFWSQYFFLDPNIFGRSFYAFRNRYAIYDLVGPRGKQWPVLMGFRNKGELVQRAHSIAHRVTKAEALDLPEQINQELYCELEPKAQKIYLDMKHRSVAEIEQLLQEGQEGSENSTSSKLTATNVLTRLLRLQQVVGGFVPAEDRSDVMVQVSTAKLDLLKDALEDLLDSGHKVVVFARFVPEIRSILKMLDTARVDHAYIYGAVSQLDRGEMVQRFQTDPECKVFVAQVQTAGLGITLHAADTSIIYSADFNYANYDQCKARIHRIGQKHTVNHIHLVARDTVDEKIYQALREKESVAHDIVNCWRKYF